MKDLQQKLGPFIDPSARYFDVSFMTATYLDPRWSRIALTTEESIIARDNIKSVLKDVQPSPCSLPTPSTSKFHLLFASQRTSIENTEVGKEIENYHLSLSHTEQDPITFWIEKATVYPVLHKYALDLLSLPSSTAAVERLVSYCSFATAGRRNRLRGQNLEKEIFLNKNQEFYE